MKPRASAIHNTYDVDDDESLYDTRLPTSTRRYTTTDKHGNQVMIQGGRRVVIHQQPIRKNGIHPFLYIGVGMALMVALWVGIGWVGYWWQQSQTTQKYGYPRTYQTDAVVGLGDNPHHPSHFVFMNLYGRTMVIVLIGGDPAHAKVYKGPSLISDGGDLVPVTGDIKDVNGDGRPDIIMHVGQQDYIFTNSGKDFVQQQ